jgi:hypothetical protein
MDAQAFRLLRNAASFDPQLQAECDRLERKLIRYKAQNTAFLMSMGRPNEVHIHVETSSEKVDIFTNHHRNTVLTETLPNESEVEA